VDSRSFCLRNFVFVAVNQIRGQICTSNERDLKFADRDLDPNSNKKQQLREKMTQQMMEENWLWVTKLIGAFDVQKGRPLLEILFCCSTGVLLITSLPSLKHKIAPAKTHSKQGSCLKLNLMQQLNIF